MYKSKRAVIGSALSVASTSVCEIDITTKLETFLEVNKGEILLIDRVQLIDVVQHILQTHSIKEFIDNFDTITESK